MGGQAASFGGQGLRLTRSSKRRAGADLTLVYDAGRNSGYPTIPEQTLLPLVADPLGKKPVPGSHDPYQPGFALSACAAVRCMQIILIVVGHVIVVYLAHLRAGERSRSAQPLLSKYPMLVLTVLYTTTSLCILAQPITRGR